ncbi:MAG: hypothetical protein ACTHK7_10650 [Aureliella sp.]
MKTQKLTPVDAYLSGSWEALGNGAPVLVALAQMCSEAWTRGAPSSAQLHAEPSHAQPLQGQAAQSSHDSASAGGLSLDEFSGEALAILFAARDRGIIELKAVNTAFDAAARLLAVYVEETDERTIAFRDSHKPEITVRFLDGFRELCERGLVIHHIYRDFSLSPRGFELAREVQRERVQRWLDMATEFGLHD